ncbi:MAG: hypothetical protein GY928_01610, partial [Colwellia sp.]|nr:hypothetical protein [Colwellia sp.]
VSNDWLSEHIFCGHPSNISRCINAVKGKKNKILNRLVKNLLKCEDRPFLQYLTQHPEIGESFNKVMVKCTVAIPESVLAVYDFSPFRTVVDVGGGFGALLAPILKKNPGISGVLFDMPSVIQGAKEHLEKESLLDRCNVVVGDFFDSVPQGGDLYILKSIIHSLQ